MKKRFLKVVVLGCLGASVVACVPKNNQKTESENVTKTENTMETKAPYAKKYTNKDFYKDGKLQADVALKAYEEMLGHYGIQLSKFMRDNLWITDFELGDFENVGMAG